MGRTWRTSFAASRCRPDVERRYQFNTSLVTTRRVCRNVKHWRDAAMALRWTGATMMEAAKGFRRLKAHRQLPILKAALAAHGARHTIKPVLERQTTAA